MPRTALALLTVATVGVTACGGPSAEEKRQAQARQQAVIAKRKAAKQRARDRAAAQAKYEECHSQVGDFLDTLGELNSRLDIGLTFNEYSDKVADVKVAYDRIPFKEMKAECLGAALPAEKSLNQYVKAANKWQTCLDDYDCDTDSIQPALQKYWSSARNYREIAADAIDKLQPSSGAP